MASARFEANPAFDMELERAEHEALQAFLGRVANLAKANASWSQTIPGSIAVQKVTQVAGVTDGEVTASSDLAHFFEGGTVDRYTASGAYRGKGPARPFMHPALQQAQSEGFPPLNI